MDKIYDDQNYSMWVLLSRTRSGIYEARRQELAHYKISVAQAAVLTLLASTHKTITIGEISDKQFKKPHTISELVSRMEKRGLVRKVKDRNNKREVIVVLTDKGNEAYLKAEKIESIRAIMSVLSTKELKQLKSYLQRLRTKAKTYRNKTR